jgi:Collagen triple helix repeat (20 copies)
MIHPIRLGATALLCLSSLLSACDDTDAPGSAGANGLQGAIGPKGATGPQGPAGAQGAQGPQGIQSAPGPTGAQGLPGPTGAQGLPGPTGAQGAGFVGAVYVIPGSGGSSGGGYLTLSTLSARAQLNITCNYGSPGDNEAFWFAGPNVTAGDIVVVNQLDGQPLQTFQDLAFNQGGQDRATVNGSTALGAWPWQAVFTANDGGTLTRWNVTVTGSSGGNCTAIVYANNGGAALVSLP